ncbi:GCN5-like protein [Gracilaria domingensis]|nr:GCN5-like protein [Gracilaria domingensis]
MLSVHLREAERRKNELKPHLNAGAQKVQKAASDLSDALLQRINEDVQEVYQAERQIETELRNIERLLSSNGYQIHQWTTLLDRLTTELKELGDVSNWVEVLEQSAIEIKNISTKL